MPSSIRPGVQADGAFVNQLGSAKRKISTDLNQGLKNPWHYLDTAGLSATATIGDGTTAARGAIAAADTDGPIVLPPGTYAIASNLTITNKVTFLPGAKLKPASGVVVTLSGGYVAEDTQHVFDISASGSFQISNQRIITPRHFGALGNGVNTEDDSTAIQAALTEAVRSNATLDLTAGVFYIGSSLSIDCTGGAKTVEIRGGGMERTFLWAMNVLNGPVLQLTNVDIGSSQYLHRSKLSDFQLIGTKPNGSRVDVVLDLQGVLHTTFSRIRPLGANRAAVKLGYNHSNHWVDCLIQPGVFTENAHYTYGIVCTNAVNYANEYTGVTLLSCDVGYLACAGGQGNTFTNCRPESCRVFAMYWNGGNAWSFNGYIEAAGYSTSPHQFVTIDNDDASLINDGPWVTQGSFCFNGTARQFASDVSTTATGTGGTDTVTVASASGLYRGAKVEVTGAGASGGVLYTRIASISGTTITLDDDLVGSISGQAFLQPIQCSCDLSTAYPPTNVSVTTVGWSTTGTSSLYVVAAAFGAKLAYPGLGTDQEADVMAGTNAIVEFCGSHDAAADIEIVGGKPPTENTPSRFVKTHRTADNGTPGSPSLAKLSRWPWASKTVVRLPLDKFTLTAGTSWGLSNYTYQNAPLWLLQTADISGYVTGSGIFSFQQHPELQGRWVAIDVEFICAYSPWSSNDDFYAGGLWIYGTSGELGLMADSSGVMSRPPGIPEILVTGSISSASTSLTVSSGTGFKVGDIVTVAGAGASGALLIAGVTAVAGSTLTLDTAAGTTVSDEQVLRCALQTRTLTFETSLTDDAMNILLYAYVNEGEGNALLIKEVRVREVGNPDIPPSTQPNWLATTTQLASLTASINTNGKSPGKMVFNTTTSKPVYATGAAASDTWVDATGTTAHTPV